jgi:hypothetical protein
MGNNKSSCLHVPSPSMIRIVIQKEMLQRRSIAAVEPACSEISPGSNNIFTVFTRDQITTVRSATKLQKTKEQIDDHIRQRACVLLEPPLFQERMTSHQMAQIKKRKVGEDPCKNWFGIFEILFPEAPLPASPYTGEGDDKVVQAFVQFFRAVGPEAMFEFVRDRQEQGLMLHFDVPMQTLVDETFELCSTAIQRIQHRPHAECAMSIVHDVVGVATKDGITSAREERQHAEKGNDFDKLLTDIQDSVQEFTAEDSDADCFPDGLEAGTDINDFDFGQFDPSAVDGAFDVYALAIV